MSRLGYSVGRNKPYAGGFITEHYGNPASGCIPSSSNSTARSTWTNGGANAAPRFAQVAADFVTLAEALAAVPLGDLGPFQAAAE